MRHAFVRVVLTSTVLSTLAACDAHTTTSPPPVSGKVYELQSVQGQPLPVVEQAAGADTTWLVGERLTLQDDGKATGLQWRRVESGSTSSITTYTVHYRYTIDGSQIFIAIDCPPPGLCVAPRSGTVSEAELVVGYVGSGPEAPVWRYTRLLPMPPD